MALLLRLATWRQNLIRMRQWFRPDDFDTECLSCLIAPRKRRFSPRMSARFNLLQDADRPRHFDTNEGTGGAFDVSLTSDMMPATCS
jgi:hypothetical protein